MNRFRTLNLISEVGMEVSELCDFLFGLAFESVVPLSAGALCILPLAIEATDHGKHTRGGGNRHIESVTIAIVRCIAGDVCPDGHDSTKSANSYVQF